jgi:hypothetical protein
MMLGDGDLSGGLENSTFNGLSQDGSDSPLWFSAPRS